MVFVLEFLIFSVHSRYLHFQIVAPCFMSFDEARQKAKICRFASFRWSLQDGRLSRSWLEDCRSWSYSSSQTCQTRSHRCPSTAQSSQGRPSRPSCHARLPGSWVEASQTSCACLAGSGALARLIQTKSDYSLDDPEASRCLDL